MSLVVVPITNLRANFGDWEVGLQNLGAFWETRCHERVNIVHHVGCQLSSFLPPRHANWIDSILIQLLPLIILYSFLGGKLLQLYICPYPPDQLRSWNMRGEKML